MDAISKGPAAVRSLGQPLRGERPRAGTPPPLPCPQQLGQGIGDRASETAQGQTESCGAGPGAAGRSGARGLRSDQGADRIPSREQSPAYPAPLSRFASPASRGRAAAAAPSPRDPPLPGAERGGCPASPAAAAVTGRAGRTGLLRGPAASLRPGRGCPAASALYHHAQADSAAGKAARPAPGRGRCAVPVPRRCRFLVPAGLGAALLAVEPEPPALSGPSCGAGCGLGPSRSRRPWVCPPPSSRWGTAWASTGQDGPGPPSRLGAASCPGLGGGAGCGRFPRPSLLEGRGAALAGVAPFRSAAASPPAACARRRGCGRPLIGQDKGKPGLGRAAAGTCGDFLRGWQAAGP